MNRVIISGRLVKAPEAHTTQGGVSRSTFDVAVQRRYKNPDGKYDADFLTVVAWRGAADFCNKYLDKGRMVAVEGSLQKRSYTAQDGSKRFVTEIVADNVEALGGANNDHGKHQEQSAPEATGKLEQRSQEDFQEVDPGDELPF